MSTTALALNPFSLMMEPELVLQTIERSQQLRGLRRHKLRPLDKPLIPYTKEAVASRAAFDAAIDAAKKHLRFVKHRGAVDVADATFDAPRQVHRAGNVAAEDRC